MWDECFLSGECLQTCQIGKPHFVPFEAIQTGEREFCRYRSADVLPTGSVPPRRSPGDHVRMLALGSAAERLDRHCVTWLQSHLPA